MSLSSSSPVALVTGAGSGIGRAVADRFLREGWRVIAVGRRLQPLEDLGKSAAKDQVLALACDLTVPTQVGLLVEEILAQFTFASSLKTLVNNAGIFTRRPFTDTDDELWRLMWESNVLAPVRLTRALLSLLKPNQGSIVNISSTLGLRPTADTSAYSAAKAAMINWTQTLALETAPDRVRVNCVCPGIVDTPIHSLETRSASERAAFDQLHPLGRVGRPEDVAHAVWSLAGPGSEWITGSILKVDGGIDL